MTTLWIIWILQAAICAVNQWVFRRRMIAQDARMAALTPDRQKAAVVIIPVKGRNADTESFFESLRTQQYRDYRIIYTLESESDPSASAIREHLSLSDDEIVFHPGRDSRDSPGLTEIRITIAGESTHSGQKVHNQLAAFNDLRDTDELIVFADADIHADPTWLARLTAPLNDGSREVCCGYRWLIPETKSLANLVAATINATAVTGGGNPKFQLLWGGSTAVTRKAFDQMNVPGYFEGSLNDDLQLSRAARHAGFKLGFVHSLQLP
jgi:ceramide glucosyltransferase